MHQPSQPGSRFPKPILPTIPLAGVNEPITLFEGEMTLTDTSERKLTCPGKITLEWFPYPKIQFEAALTAGDYSFGEDWIPISLVKSGRPFEGKVQQSSPSVLLRGVVKTDQISTFCSASSVRFQLPNCFITGVDGLQNEKANGFFRGRTRFVDEKWSIVLDAVEGINSIQTRLKKESGYAITHVGEIKRADGQPIDPNELEELLDALTYFFSFAMARNTGVANPTGFDADGNELWQAWSVTTISPWQFHLSWIDALGAREIAELFPGFMRNWFDPDWHDVLKRSIEMYLEASRSPLTADGSIVLSQCALEALAWKILVDDAKVISVDGFEKLTAADKIRTMLAWAKIPAEIPAWLPKLAEFGKEFNHSQSPDALSAIRNAIAHVSPKLRTKFNNLGPIVKVETWKLSMWYLELCLLWSLGYQGEYANRLMPRRYLGQLEQVPWAAQSVPLRPSTLQDSLKAQAHKPGLAAAIGQWPGDKTDEEIEETIERLS
jgi:hypothetical protein